ncbi:MAG: hypothetical protein ACRCZF_26915, partial [Gemmataceae bacterium]
MRRLMHHRGSWLAAIFACITSVALLSSDSTTAQTPSEPEVPTTQLYVGSVSGGGDGAKIALVVDAGHFIAYVCGAEESFNTNCSAWFKGSISNATIEAKGPKATLDANLKAKAIEGTIQAADMKFPFTAHLAEKEGTIAGLYRAELKSDEEDLVAGWIAD